MDSFSFATITNTCYCHVHCFCSLCDGIKPCCFIAIIIVLRNTSCPTFIFFCDFIPILFRVRFLTKKESMGISSFALIDGMHNRKSKFLFCLASAFKLLDKIPIKVILIDRLSLPRYHVTIIQVVLVSTPFKVLCPVVCFNLVFVINHQSFFITWDKVQGYESVYLIMGIVTMPVTQ